MGKDQLAGQLRTANDKEGLISAYQVVESKPTGACAVVITGHDRSVYPLIPLFSTLLLLLLELWTDGKRREKLVHCALRWERPKHLNQLIWQKMISSLSSTELNSSTWEGSS